MAFVTPTSWSANPRRLQDATTPIASIPAGQNIYFVELTTDFSLRNARLSSHVNSAAMMTFVINQEVLEDETLRNIFTKTLLGGWNSLTSSKKAPYKHPYLPGLYAKDIVELQSMEVKEPNVAQVWGTYNLCKVTVSFESTAYPVDYTKISTDNYNPNWVEIKITSSSNRVSSPLGWYTFDDDPLVPATFGNWTVMPYSNIQMTVFQSTYDQCFGGVAAPTSIIPTWAPQIGKVNSIAFAGAPPTKLLLDSSELQPYRDWLGNRLYNIRFNFIYNQWGWNTALYLDGTPKEISRPLALGGSKPFVGTSFTTILAGVNP